MILPNEIRAYSYDCPSLRGVVKNFSNGSVLMYWGTVDNRQVCTWEPLDSVVIVQERYEEITGSTRVSCRGDDRDFAASVWEQRQRQLRQEREQERQRLQQFTELFGRRQDRLSSNNLPSDE